MFSCSVTKQSVLDDVTFPFSKKDPDVFSKVIGNLVMLLQDDNVAVSKKVMLSMSNLYRIALQVKVPNSMTTLY